jgi:hypothetical protein
MPKSLLNAVLCLAYSGFIIYVYSRVVYESEKGPSEEENVIF